MENIIHLAHIKFRINFSLHTVNAKYDWIVEWGINLPFEIVWSIACIMEINKFECFKYYIMINFSKDN